MIHGCFSVVMVSWTQSRYLPENLLDLLALLRGEALLVGFGPAGVGQHLLDAGVLAALEIFEGRHLVVQPGVDLVLEVLAAVGEPAPGAFHRVREALAEGRLVHREAAVRDLAAAKSGAVEEVPEGEQGLEAAVSVGDGDPLVHQGVALAVRDEAGADEDGLVRGEAGDAGEDRGFAAAEGGEHPVAEPADHRVQPPEVVEGGPGGLLPPALRDRCRHAAAVGGQREPAVLREHFAGERGEAVPQVLGGVERQGGGLGIRLEVQPRVCRPRAEAFEAGPAVGEVVREEGQRGLRRGWDLRRRGGAVFAPEQREQVVALAPLLRAALEALVEKLRLLAGGDRAGGDLPPRPRCHGRS